MFRKIIFTVLMVLCMVSSAAAESWQWEQISMTRPSTGVVVTVDFKLDHGPSTDDERIVIANETAVFLSSNGVTPQLVRSFRSNLEEQLGSHVVIAKITVGNLFEMDHSVSFNTIGL